MLAAGDVQVWSIRDLDRIACANSSCEQNTEFAGLAFESPRSPRILGISEGDLRAWQNHAAKASLARTNL
jgi:hypothetical protein